MTNCNNSNHKKVGELQETETPPDLILASASRWRAQMLGAAGVEVEIMPATLDEAAVKLAMQADGAAPAAIAQALADAKALEISARRPNALVIAADQVMVCDGVLFSKSADLAAARTTLQTLRGQTHELISAVAIAEAGAVLWRISESARLTARNYSDDFIDDYLARMGEGILDTVGGYQLESLGAQLFEHIDGDWFTIIGLPLLPLLDFLRGRGILRR